MTPNPNLLFGHSHGAFTHDELDALERYCDGLPLRPGQLGQGNSYENQRITRIAEIKPEPPIRWLYERMLQVVQAVNGNYRFDITGFHETFQFMVYHAHEGGHFSWHIDQGPPVPRKLSLTLQLTDPSLYEGGDLQFFSGDVERSASRERGVVIGFPSYVVHRVTPVTAGTRKAIVAWVTGPDFR